MSKRPSIQLGAQEYQILRALAVSQSFQLSSTQRLRFEMLGLIEDRADGVRLTRQGRSLALEPDPSVSPNETLHEADAARDPRGRKLPFQRHSPFPSR